MVMGGGTEAEAARWRGDGERRRRRTEAVVVAVMTAARTMALKALNVARSVSTIAQTCSSAQAHTLSRQVKVVRGARLVRTCRGRSGVRRRSAPEASDERATSNSCQCRWALQRLSGAARAMQATFDEARPEGGHQGGQGSVRSIVACEGWRRRGHAGRAARRRAGCRLCTSGTSRSKLTCRT